MVKLAQARPTHCLDLRMTLHCTAVVPRCHPMQVSFLVPFERSLTACTPWTKAPTTLSTAPSCRHVVFFVVHSPSPAPPLAVGSNTLPPTLCNPQIYNEHVYDVILDKEGKFPLAIHENTDDGVYVEGLSEFLISTPADALEIVAQGDANRCACLHTCVPAVAAPLACTSHTDDAVRLPLAPCNPTPQSRERHPHERLFEPQPHHLSALHRAARVWLSTGSPLQAQPCRSCRYQPLLSIIVLVFGCAHTQPSLTPVAGLRL